MLINIVIRYKISYLSLTESNFASNVRNQYYVPDFYFTDTTQKMKFSAKDFFSKCDQICRKLRIWSHILKKSLMENFCAV